MGAVNGGGDNGSLEPRLKRLEDFVEVSTNYQLEFAEEHKRLLAAW